jgi:hypothetical protein
MSESARKPNPGRRFRQMCRCRRRPWRSAPAGDMETDIRAASPPRRGRDCRNPRMPTVTSCAAGCMRSSCQSAVPAGRGRAVPCDDGRAPARRHIRSSARSGRRRRRARPEPAAGRRPQRCGRRPRRWKRPPSGSADRSTRRAAVSRRPHSSMSGSPGSGRSSTMVRSGAAFSSSVRHTPDRTREGGGHQGLGIVGLRIVENLFRATGFDHLAIAHDHDLVGERAHHLQVMADEQIGEPVICAAGRAADRPPAPARSCRAPMSAHPAGRPAASAPWRARSRCAGAGRRKTRAGSGSASRVEPTSFSAPAPRGVALRSKRIAGLMDQQPFPMICSIDMRGLRLPKGSWKTICMSLRSGRIALRKEEMSISRKRIVPFRSRSAASAPAQASSCRNRIRRQCPASRPGAP